MKRDETTVTVERPPIPEYSLGQLPVTVQGRALYERAEEAYPEPWRSEVMATVHRIEKEAAALTENEAPS